jgi:tRNA threonylcarbamoyladenosine biosynthesis protein TsaB
MSSSQPLQRTVLALDLSTPHGQIAIVHGTELLFEREFVSDRSHNSMLYGPLAEALQTVGTTLDIIAIGTGPGSYTGVRIAIAAAQGIALSRSIPVVGWSSLATLSDIESYTVVGDARRGQAYLAQVTHRRLHPLQLMPMTELPAALQAGSPLYTADSTAPSTAPHATTALPSAQRLAHIISSLSDAEIQKLQQQPLEPHYLQEAFVTQPKKTPL